MGEKTSPRPPSCASLNSIDNYFSVLEYLNTLHITASVTWSMVLINNVPTGVTNNRGPWTPDECHEALVVDNPGYAALNITHRPRWIKPPTIFGVNSRSSLIVAFEDPDGHIARELVNSKHLYIFGTRARVKHWIHKTDRTLPPLKR
ncbi:hypothetical protein H4582DRAFT_2032971 [Lactarius indigo]|nr:hypothetical protein H4582DRAFT_2032971 [Lactarius indigo]